jgi:hypothetical protein
MTTFPNVTLDGLQLLFRVEAGPVDVDAVGVEWLLTKFEGWPGIPAPRTARTDRPGHSGAFRAAAYRGPRIVTLEWQATAPDIPTLRAAEQQVAAICADPARLYEMVVTESGSSRSVMVELDDAILTSPKTAFASVFSARVAAPDPRKHDTGWQSPIGTLGTAPIGGLDFTAPGVVTASPGLDFGTPGSPSAVTVKNSGTATARPLFAITGPISRPQVVDVTNGVTLLYTGTLGATDVLTINTDEFPVQGFPGHGVYLNTTINQRPLLLTPNGWPRVLPGSSVTYNLRATAFTAASMTVSLRSAWH